MEHRRRSIAVTKNFHFQLKGNGVVLDFVVLKSRQVAGGVLSLDEPVDPCVLCADSQRLTGASTTPLCGRGGLQFSANSQAKPCALFTFNINHTLFHTSCRPGALLDIDAPTPPPARFSAPKGAFLVYSLICAPSGGDYVGGLADPRSPS